MFSIVAGTSFLLAGLIVSSTIPASAFAEESEKRDRLDQININPEFLNPRVSIGLEYIDTFQSINQ
ncbi:hypothetical protein FT637_27360 [Bacillus cereus]|uniref:hypothetical protein n=1 Tax=Bacillus cereus TaxID=1396 RepID=UPI001879B63E|nr:hypothetical protein [Bacillus cereus]MBE7106596.1 hypothetical protein [Bacillus cereus]